MLPLVGMLMPCDTTSGGAGRDSQPSCVECADRDRFSLHGLDCDADCSIFGLSGTLPERSWNACWGDWHRWKRVDPPISGIPSPRTRVTGRHAILTQQRAIARET
jgi:hypothetical protein